MIFTFSEGYAAYEAGDYRKSFMIFSSLAESGDLESQILLAGMYRLGWGVQESVEKAAHWYGIAAQSGNFNAMHNYSMTLFEYNPEEGIPYMLELVERFDDSLVQSALGDVYAGTFKLPEALQAQYRDDAIAVQWYSKAGKNGFSYAYHKLAKMYLEGRGCERNVGKAIFYLEKAVGMLYGASARLLAKLYTEGLPDLKPDEEKAALWRRRLQKLES